MNVIFAAGDHLIGDLDKDGSHSLRRIVVSRDTVDHLDSIDQARNRRDHSNGVALVQRLAETVQGVQVLDIVLEKSEKNKRDS